VGASSPLTCDEEGWRLLVRKGVGRSRGGRPAHGQNRSLTYLPARAYSRDRSHFFDDSFYAASVELTHSARPQAMTGICAKRSGRLMRDARGPRKIGLDDLRTKSEHWVHGRSRPPRPLSFRCGPYRLPPVLAEGRVPLGATCREIRTADHIARPD
jgi:hypothetical protein